jgi:peptidoglycan/xylan/chitin deacetylase (PgdA/CDA1 family)/SAM-dependent methyltransferase
MARLVVAAGIQRAYDVLRRRTLGRLAPQPGPWISGLLVRVRRRLVSLIQKCGWRLEDFAVQPPPPAPPRIRLAEQAGNFRGNSIVEDARPSDPRAYWEHLFSRPDPWKYDSDYERVKYQRTLAMLDGMHIGRTLELACAEGHFTLELARLVEHVQATDISAAALGRAAERCAGQSNVEFTQLDFFHEEIAGAWDLIVCSEVLYYTNDQALLTSVARKIGAALAPGGMLLSAHAHLVADDPGEAGFDWDHPYGGKRIFEVLADAGGLVPVKRLVTPLYSIVLYRRRCDRDNSVTEVVQQAPVGAVLSPHVESAVLWNGAVRTRSDVDRNFGYDVPILMYHRIVDRPNPELARWAVSTPAFGRQMEFLRRRGFHTLSMHQLVQARREGRPLAGRPIILSFDDAYLDFLENGLPVLRRKGFGATVFTPTGHIGGVADWDARFGPAAPILDRAQLGNIARLGIEIGSHLHTHTRVDQLSFNAVLQEAFESRRILAEITGSPPSVVATPYGSLDRPALSILRTAGFELVTTTDHGIARLIDRGRVVPRLEVSHGSLAFLHALLDRGTLEAPTADELAGEADER